MDLGLGGRVALVTAASKGLGLGAARALAAEGAQVVMCARGTDVLEREAAVIGAHAIVADVTDPAVPARLVAETVERFGRLDVVVGNAGGPPTSRALDVTDDGVLDAVNANLLSSVRLVREAVPVMRPAGWGRICLITSSAVKQPIPSLALSNIARTGLWGWAKTAAADLAADGITLNLACPGLHDTERVRQRGGPPPGARLGDPDDFGAVVAFLCSAQAAFVTGTAVLVDGGATMGLL